MGSCRPRHPERNELPDVAAAGQIMRPQTVRCLRAGLIGVAGGQRFTRSALDRADDGSRRGARRGRLEELCDHVGHRAGFFRDIDGRGCGGGAAGVGWPGGTICDRCCGPWRWLFPSYRPGSSAAKCSYTRLRASEAFFNNLFYSVAQLTGVILLWKLGGQSTSGAGEVLTAAWLTARNVFLLMAAVSLAGTLVDSGRFAAI